MDTTRESLLIRIKDHADDAAWREFRDLYAPLLYRYARARGLNHDDAEDVRATCYEAIVTQIGDFDYQKQKGGFKAWLRTMVNRRVADLLRKHRERIADSHELRELPAPEPTPEELFERVWNHEHLKHCVEQVRGSCTETTFEVFRMLMLEERSVPEVCRRLGIAPNQVYKAKARVLNRVRRKMAELEADSAA